MVPQKPLQSILFIPQKILYSGKGFLDYSNVLHTKKNGSFKHCWLKGSLRNQNWFFYGIAVKPLFWNLHFYEWMYPFCFIIVQKCFVPLLFIVIRPRSMSAVSVFSPWEESTVNEQHSHSLLCQPGPAIWTKDSNNSTVFSEGSSSCISQPF